MDTNLTHANYHTVHGQPEESGHYFCIAEYKGFTSQSTSAILNIHGKILFLFFIKDNIRIGQAADISNIS